MPSPDRGEERDGSALRPLTWRWCLALFAVGLLVRAGWGTFRLIYADDLSGLEFPDEQQYWSMATTLRSGGGLRDELGFQATRMPLYPLALSLFSGLDRGVVMVKAAHWLTGALAAVLIAGAGTLLFDRRVGVLTGLSVAFDPFLVFFSSLLLTETLFVTALAGLWLVLAPCLRPGGGTLRRWLVVGLVGVVIVYTREAGLGLIGLTLGFVVVIRRFDRTTLAGAALAAALVVVALLPWAARNRRVTGEWCWLTTRAGISLYDGVGPEATGGSDLGDIKQMPAVSKLSEVEWNRYFLRESFKAISEDPGRVLGLACTKLGRMWNPFPNVETYQSSWTRVVSGVWMLPLFAGTAISVVLLPISDKKRGLSITLFLLLPAVYLSVLHSLFVGSVRYRLGAIPMLEMLAAATLVAIIDRICASNAKREGAIAA